MIPWEVNQLARIYVEEMIGDAGNDRAVWRNRKTGIGLVQRVGDFLIATGQKLKGQSRSAAMPLRPSEQ